MKTIKIFDGIKLTTADEVKKYPDMTVFDEAINCTEKQRGEIVRALLVNGGTLDLSQDTTDRSRCILDLYKDEPNNEKAPTEAATSVLGARENIQVQDSTEPTENQVENMTLGEIVLECLAHDGCKIKDFCATWFGVQSKPYLWEFETEGGDS